MSIETQYKHLEARPESWRKQWYLKERNLTVWQVVGRMQAHGYSSAEAAEQFDLSLEAVLEAVDYYQRHKDLVDAETAEEGRRLRAAGLWERQVSRRSTLMTVPTINCWRVC